MKKFFLMLLAFLGFSSVSAQTDTRSTTRRDTIKADNKDKSKVTSKRSASPVRSHRDTRLTTSPIGKQPSPDVAAKNAVPTKSDTKDGTAPKKQPESGNGKTTPSIPVK